MVIVFRYLYSLSRFYDIKHYFYLKLAFVKLLHMRSIIALVIITLFTSAAFSQKEDKKENKENKENKETENTKVTPGASGVKRSIGYRFSTATADADPGKGIFRYNNKNASDVSFIFVNDNDIKGDDQNKWYRTWEDSTGASGRGQILIVKLNSEVVNIFNFTDVFTDGDGYWKFPVKYVSGTVPANDSLYYYIFNRIAHSGGKEESKGYAVENDNEVGRSGNISTGGGVTVTTREEPEVEKVEEAVEEVEKVEEAIAAPAVIVAEERVEEIEKVEKVEVVKEEPAAAAEVNVPVSEPVVVEVKVEEAPVVVVPEEIPVAAPVVKVKVEEAPVVVVPAEVTVAEPVAEVKVEEAPVVVVPVAEPVVEKAPNILEKKTKVTDKPAAAPETEIETNDKKVLPNKPDDGVPVTVSEPKKETTVAQGPPRVTETKPAESKKEPVISQNAPVVTETKPAQTTTTAAGPPRVTENKPVTQPQGTTVPQSTQKPPVAQPSQDTRPATVYQPPVVRETPASQSFIGSSTTGHGKCYRGIIELGYGLRVSEYGMNNFRFNFINGFNIRSTSIGLGIGVRKYYNTPSKHPDWHLVSSDVQIPVFLDVRTHFSSKKVTPYLGIGIGNSTSFDSDTTNNKPEGLYFHATGGI